MLKLSISCGLLVLALAGTFVLSNEVESEGDAQTRTVGNRQQLALPKQFSFDNFQRKFNKHYPSASERLLRSKLYLGRAFRAFISKISYKHAKSGSYLGVNHMSDWTPEEVKQTMMNKEIFMAGIPTESVPSERVNSGADNLATDEIPIADLASIESSLQDAVKNKESEPAFNFIATELNSLDPSEKITASYTTRPVEDGIVESKDQSVMENVPEHVVDSIRSRKSGSFIQNLIQKFKRSSMVEKFSSTPSANEIYSDHRGCLLEPREQLQCGCSFAFATIALYEWAYCKATGVKVAFSEQYPLDCGRNEQNFGCKGGVPLALRSFQGNFGLQLRDRYQYVGKDQECLSDPTTPFGSRNFVRILDEGYSHLKSWKAEKLLKKSPAVMAIMAESGLFQEYAGGVDLGHDCNGERGLGHALLLVGSGRENGEEYWLLRNSYGPDWGENGYYKLNKKSKCIVERHGLVLKFTRNPELKMLVNY